MATTKDLFERLGKEPEFAEKFTECIEAKRKEGASNYYETIIPAAAEFGYDVKPEELDAIQKAQYETISEEELGKVAGGTSCLTILATISIIGTVVSLGVTITKGMEKLDEVLRNE